MAGIGRGQESRYSRLGRAAATVCGVMMRGGDAVDLRYEKDMPKILLQNVFFSPDSS